MSNRKYEVEFSGNASSLIKELDSVTQKLDQQKVHLTSLNSAFDGIGKSVGIAVASFVSFSGVTALANISDQAKNLAMRLTDVTGSTVDAGNAQAGLYAMSQRLGASYSETAGAFARFAPALKELGAGAKEAQAIAEMTMVTAKLSGASSQEAASAVQQLGQAIGSGVLQGDELKSILENNQALARVLAAGLGVSTGELKKLGEEGKLTSAVVVNALLKGYDDIKAKSDSLPVTIGAATERFKNSFGLLVESIEKSTGVFGGMARGIENVAKVLDEASRGVPGFVGKIKEAQKAVSDLFGLKPVEEAGIVHFRKEYEKETQKIIDSSKSAAKFVLESGLVAIAGLVGALESVTGAGDGMATIKTQVDKAAKAFDGLKASASGAGKGVKELENAYKSQDKSFILGDGYGSSAAGFAVAKDKPKTDGPKEGSRGSTWEAELQRMKANAVIAGNAMSLQEEVDFWQKKLRAAKKGSEEEVNAAKEVAKLKIEIIKSANEQIKQIEQIEASAKATRITASLDAELSGVKRNVALGKLSAEAGAVTEAQIEVAKYQAQLESINRRMLAAKEESTERASLNAELERLAGDHKKRLAEIENRADDERRTRRSQEIAEELAHAQAKANLEIGRIGRAKANGSTGPGEAGASELSVEENLYQAKLRATHQRMLLAGEESSEYARLQAQLETDTLNHQNRMEQLQQTNGGGFWSSMVTQSTSAIGQIVGGYQTLQQGIASTLKSIYSQFWQEMVVKPLAAFAMRQVKELGLYKMLESAKLAITSWASGSTKTIKAAETATVVPMEAAKAGAGAAAAVAPTPFIGPALAVAAFAAIFALAMGGLKSAEGGYDIPSGVNPLVQTHAREMILPAEHADTIRGLSGSGGGSAGGSVSVNITALDARGVRDMLLDNKGALVEAIKSAQRSGFR